MKNFPARVTLVALVHLMLRFLTQTAHCFGNPAAGPGPKLLQRPLHAFALLLVLGNMRIETLPKLPFGSLASCPFNRLLLGAGGIP